MENHGVITPVIPYDISDCLPDTGMDVYYYKHLIQSVSDAILSVDPDFIIKSWNRAAEAIYGWTSREAMGLNVNELLHTEIAGISTAEAAERIRIDGRIEIEIVHTAKDGRKITAQGDIALLKDSSGTFKGYVAVIRDITERKLLEEKLAKQAAELKQRENELEEMLEGAVEDAWIMDFEKDTVTYSRDWLKRMGTESYTGRPLMNHVKGLIHPDDRETVCGQIKECIAAKKTGYELEYRILTKDAGYIWKRARGKVTYSSDGKPLKIYGASYDVTQRKTIELRNEKQAQELTQTRKMLEEDLNAMSRLHSISTRFVQKQDFSSLLDEIAGTAASIAHADTCTIQLIDQQTGNLNVAAYSGLPARFIDRFNAVHSCQSRCNALLQPGKRIIIENVTESPIFAGTPDYDMMIAAGTIAMQSTPLFSRSGKILGIICTHSHTPRPFAERDLQFVDMLARLTADIIERSDSEETLHRSNQRTELLYEVVEKLLEGDHMQSIIQELCTKVMQFLGCDVFINYLFRKDDPKTLHLNACSGISAGQSLEVEKLQRGQAACGCVAATGAKIIVGDVQHSEDERTAYIKKMGIRAYACHPLAVKDEILGTLAFASRTKDTFDAGELALMRAVCSHVAVAVSRMGAETDLISMAEELREKNKLVTDFFTNISHEFKTPLSIILVDLQLMEYRLRNVGGETQEKLGKMISVMRQNALRLLRLIGNLLDVTKIDAGFMKARLIANDIVGLVSGLVDSVKDYSENAGIAISFESSIESRTMPLDPEKMERVILNLLSNAIKHTPEGGHIFVSMKHAERSVTISVRDDGEGIPEDKKEFIFDRFRQVNTSLTRSSEGCGIGLSLTKALVELLHGKIWFSSRFGGGTEFFIELPVLPGDETSRSPEIEGMPRNRKVEMEFADIHRTGKQHV